MHHSTLGKPVESGPREEYQTIGRGDGWTKGTVISALPQAALAIPSFKKYAEQADQVQAMEQELLRKQLLLQTYESRYEKLNASRIKTVKERVEKEALEAALDSVKKEVN